MEPDSLTKQIIETKKMLKSLSLQHYFSYEVFSWVWWINIFSIVILFAVWFRFVDRKRLLEICTFGFLVNIFATFLDVIGSDFGFWDYPIRILPAIPLLFPVDMIVLPIVFMIVYQKMNTWKSYLIACTVSAAFISFVMEPFAVRIGQYRMISWEYYYSFPIYIVLAVLCKFALQIFLKSLKKANGKGSEV